MFRNNNILELEKLLISCQYLNELYIIGYTRSWENDNEYSFNWNYLFEVLTKSSPTGLFKFIFYFCETLELESLKLFLDNWKGRRPMLLQTIIGGSLWDWNSDLIEKYKTQGIIKKYQDF